ncbi:MAG: hypothetical protein K0R27_311 [Xanthobacteraceae bacterium]|jgi:SPP1 family predicted phage head-tail adaptor|nr:hypothetical protein [Xanthobacteraceae bacterium]
MIEGGKLDRRITLLSTNCQDFGRDEFNAPIKGAPVARTVWAEYAPVSDRERFASAEVTANLSARFRIRWSPDVAGVSPTWWLEFEGRTFDIVGAKEIGRREGIEITAAARAE